MRVASRADAGGVTILELDGYAPYIYRGGARATAFLGRRIALVVDHGEGAQSCARLVAACAARPGAVGDFVRALELLLGEFDRAFGGRAPPVTHALEGRSVVEVSFLDGAAGLAHHGRAGFAVGPAFLESALAPEPPPLMPHVFTYEACRNYIDPGVFTAVLDYRLALEGPECWGWVNQGFVNCLGCLLWLESPAAAARVFDYHGRTAATFLGDFEAVLTRYIESALPWEAVFHRERLPWAHESSLDNLYSGVVVHLWHRHGRGRFLRRFLGGALPLLLASGRAPATKADAATARENFFLAACYAAGADLAPLFAAWRWPLRAEIEGPACQAALAAALADGIA